MNRLGDEIVRDDDFLPIVQSADEDFDDGAKIKQEWVWCEELLPESFEGESFMGTEKYDQFHVIAWESPATAERCIPLMFKYNYGVLMEYPPFDIKACCDGRKEYSGFHPITGEALHFHRLHTRLVACFPKKKRERIIVDNWGTLDCDWYYYDQLVSWGKRLMREHLDPSTKMTIEKYKNKVEGTQVLCIEERRVFESVRDAARWCEGDASTITKCCKGKRKGHKGFTWKYYDVMEDFLDEEVIEDEWDLDE